MPSIVGNRKMRLLRTIVLSAFCAALLATDCSTRSSAAAQTSGPPNLQASAVKVGFLYNFAKFVSWPEDRLPAPDAPVVFCLHKGSLNEAALQPLVGQTVHNRRIEVRIFDELPPEGCHLLFANGEASQDELKQIADFGFASSALTVADQARFTQIGGHIELFEEGNRLRFAINLEQAKNSGIVLSSKLLQLAVIVGPARE